MKKIWKCCILFVKIWQNSLKISPNIMKIRSKIFLKGGIKKLGKTSRGIGPRNLVSKNQLLSSKIAGSSPRTDRHAHTHTEKTKLRDPFFSAIIFFILIRFRMRIRSTCKNKGGLIHKKWFFQQSRPNMEHLAYKRKN